MSDLPTTNTLSDYDKKAKENALIAYALMAVGLWTGVFWFIGGIWAIVKRDDAVDSIFENHYKNMISVFWWGLGWTVVGFILSLVVVGFVILFVVWIWTLYRLIKGLAALTSDKDYI